MKMWTLMKASKQQSNSLLTARYQLVIQDKLVKQLRQDTQALKHEQLQYKIIITCRVLSHEWKTNTVLLQNITISMYAYLVSSPVQANLHPALRSTGDD